MICPAQLPIAARCPLECDTSSVRGPHRRQCIRVPPPLPCAHLSRQHIMMAGRLIYVEPSLIQTRRCFFFFFLRRWLRWNFQPCRLCSPDLPSDHTLWRVWINRVCMFAVSCPLQALHGKFHRGFGSKMEEKSSLACCNSIFFYFFFAQGYIVPASIAINNIIFSKSFKNRFLLI